MNSFIETLNQWSLELPGLAWQMFWQSSLLIAALFVFDFTMRRKVRAAIRYALWLVILIKLVVPPTLALPTGLAWWLRSSPPPQRLVAAGNVVVTYGRDSISIPPPSAAPIVAMPAPHLSTSSLMLAGSALVSLALLGWLLVRWLQVSRDIRRAKEASEPLRQLLVEAGRLAGLRSPVRLRLTQRKMSPAVCGLFRPVILLPEMLAGTLPGSQLRAVLVHELIHVKRGDVGVNCLQTLVQIVYWWHPLVWLANARLRHVREEAVDDAVMLTLRDEADCYAPTLLEVAKLAFSRPLASLGLVGILESRSALRQRIERLIDFQMPRRAGLSFVSLLGIAAFTAVAVPMGEAPEKLNPPINAPESAPDKTEASNNLVQAGRILLERGKFDEAEEKLRRALAVKPTNPAASFYLARLGEVRRQKELPGAGSNFVNNLGPRTNLIHTSPARQAIFTKMDQIRLDSVVYDGLPLMEVVRHLQKEVMQHDPDKQGVNFLLNQTRVPQPKGKVDPTTGLPVTLAETDIKAVRVTLQPPLTNVCLADVLDAIVKCADKPIKYSILDYGIAFSPKGKQSLPLSSRKFKVDPNTFIQGLESATGFDLASASQTRAINTNFNARVQTAVIAYFRSISVNLDPPKSVYLNDREGSLWVRASPEDLDVIGAAFQKWSAPEPQINIRVRFVEVPKSLADQLWQSHPYTNSFIQMGGDAAMSQAVLSDEQSLNFLKTLKNKSGVRELSQGEVTTLIARQVQLQHVDLKTVVFGMTNGSPITRDMQFGPILDLVSSVQADGYTIQMKLTPTVMEFLGYDEGGGASRYLQVPGKNGAPPEITLLPPRSINALPLFRLREMTINTSVLDGQTVVLGHFKPQDWFGENRQSPFVYTQEDPQRNLLVLVTPTLIDPAGNRIHQEDRPDILPGRTK